MSSHLPPAVVLTGNLGPPRKPKSAGEISLALSRSLGRRGVTVYRFHPDRSLIDLESRYCTHVPCPNLYEDEPGLLDALVAFARKLGTRPVIFPASDGGAAFLARSEEHLAPHYALATASWPTIRTIQDKQALLEHAQSIGVPVPETRFPKTVAAMHAVASGLAYPVVIKPLTSQDWKMPAVVAAIGAVKAIVVHSADELVAAYLKVEPLAPNVMVQEIVPGEIDRLLTFIGYVSHHGTALAGCVRKKLRQYPAGFGYCCLTETVIDAEVMDLSIRLLTSLGYRGIGGVEFKRDPRDGRPKLIEINTRAVRTTAAAIGAGVDLPWIAYQDLTQATPPAPVFHYAVPVRWMHLRSEVRAALALVRKGELGFFEWLRIFRGRKVMAVWAWDDLRPSVLDLALPFFHRVSRLVSGVLHRRQADVPVHMEVLE